MTQPGTTWPTTPPSQPAALARPPQRSRIHQNSDLSTISYLRILGESGYQTTTRSARNHVTLQRTCGSLAHASGCEIE
ncbi:MAG: hypothetical protein ACF8AM_02835 [Rhodopirellula sp. JB055]|uniref:hypothetical protein n=1 Tax=Rhodopirellula sp. JB055 TaxID=3342846 RepID=UPI00370A780F